LTEEVAMPQVTLAEVGAKAIADREFWQQLLKEPETALTARSLTLSPADLAALKEAILQNSVGVDLRKTVKHVQDYCNVKGWESGWIGPFSRKSIKRPVPPGGKPR
jgi:hypothetical protein